MIEAIEGAGDGPTPAGSPGSATCRGSPSEIPILVRGNLATPGPKVGPGVPAFLTDPDNRYEAEAAVRRVLARPAAGWPWRVGSPGPARGRRLFWLACWPTGSGSTTSAPAWSPRPRTSGTPARHPRHPELLEFLAAELVRSGWSAKALHRLILTSSVYRQSSSQSPQAARLDPDNRLLARFPLRRLDAEAIRDAMLAASGELDRPPGRTVRPDPPDRLG